MSGGRENNYAENQDERCNEPSQPLRLHICPFSSDYCFVRALHRVRSPYQGQWIGSLPVNLFFRLGVIYTSSSRTGIAEEPW